LILHGAGGWAIRSRSFQHRCRMSYAAPRQRSNSRSAAAPAHGFSSPKNKDKARADAESIAVTARTLKRRFGG
ncbi:MAG: hypothetical protein J2P50_20710, partial [Hyphomicrobiaceae bacterium]|nr:hypothetical protein [Hyphomicrobiaceae bacterium]